MTAKNRVKIVALLMLALAMTGPGAGIQVDRAEAGWLTRLLKEAGEAGRDGSRAGTGIAGFAGDLAKLPPHKASRAVTATVSAEGHWTFANASGQKFTAASADEMKRMPGALVPDAPEGRGMAVYLSEDAAFTHRDLLKDLPDGAQLNAVVDRVSYKIARAGPVDAGQYFARLPSGIEVRLTTSEAFREAVWQLGRTMNGQDLRLISLQLDGPQRLNTTAGSRAHQAKAQGRPAAEQLDPRRLPAAMADMRGQTALLTGRIEGDTLIFLGNGGEARVKLAPVLKAAAVSDVNVVIINAAKPRQPGTRNWLWQTVEIDGLKDALGSRRRDEFLVKLAGADKQLAVTVKAIEDGRTSMTAIVRDVDDSGTGVGDLFADVVSEVTGTVVSKAVEAAMVSSERQKELDTRIVPGIPSYYQFAYIGFILPGLMALGVARSWWFALWPAETRADYGSRFGYEAARMVRLLAFVFLFLPLVGLPALVWRILMAVWFWATLPVRLLRSA